MQSDFRRRAFTPVVLPLTLVGAVLLFAWSLAQILLVVSAGLAAAIAFALALYVLVIASLVASRRRISSRALAVSLALGMLAIVSAGAIAKAAGPRPLEHEEAVAEGEVEGEGEEGAAAGEEGATEEGAAGEDAAAAIPEDAAVFVAVEIGPFGEAPDTLPAGDTTIAIDNQGETVHTVLFEQLGSEPIAEAQGGQVDTGTVTLQPGDYTYYCDVPGHRTAGMEGTLTVE